MLTCRDVASRATEYMEGGLSIRARLEFRMHLLMCGVCRLYVRQLVVTRQALRRLPRALPSDDDLDLLLGMFRSASHTNGQDSDRPQ